MEISASYQYPLSFQSSPMSKTDAFHHLLFSDSSVAKLIPILLQTPSVPVLCQCNRARGTYVRQSVPLSTQLTRRIFRGSPLLYRLPVEGSVSYTDCNKNAILNWSICYKSDHQSTLLTISSAFHYFLTIFNLSSGLSMNHLYSSLLFSVLSALAHCSKRATQIFTLYMCYWLCPAIQACSLLGQLL